MQWVDVDGSRVRVLRTDTESEGPPLLLINGMAARLEMWQPLCSAITDRPLLMFDFPGITGRPARDLPLEMPGLARWLGRPLDALDVESADVLGYSWGGVLAQQFARDTSERVRALVLASTNFGFGGVYSVGGYQRQIISLTGWTSLPWLQELTVSTLVVAGDDDPYVPSSTTRRLAQSIPRARLELIPGGGHLLPINQPNRLAQAIDDFLR